MGISVASREAGGSIWVCASIAALAGLLFGIDTGNIAGALVYIQHDFNTSTFQQEIIVSITILMAFVGAFGSGGFADKFGRRQLILFSAMLFFIGALLGGGAQNLLQLIFARAMLGFAIGVSSFCAPLYISEISPPHMRGRLVLLYGAAITFGEALAFLIDYFLSFWQAWRAMIWVGAIPSLMLVVGVMRLPESAHFNILKAKPKINTRVNPLNLTQQITAVRQLFGGKLKKPLIIGLGFALAQQLSGINTIMYYGPILLAQAGFGTHQSAIWATFILGSFNAVMTIVTMAWVDKVGRRKLMITGTLVATFALCGFMVNQHYFFDNAYVSLTWLLLFIFGYCLSLGSLFWVIVSEIFPLEARARLMGICVGVQWLANFFVALVCLSIVEWLGLNTLFAGFALICLLSSLFTYYYLPETNQRSLDSIGDSW